MYNASGGLVIPLRRNPNLSRMCMDKRVHGQKNAWIRVLSSPSSLKVVVCVWMKMGIWLLSWVFLPLGWIRHFLLHLWNRLDEGGWYVHVIWLVRNGEKRLKRVDGEEKQEWELEICPKRLFTRRPLPLPFYRHPSFSHILTLEIQETHAYGQNPFIFLIIVLLWENQESIDKWHVRPFIRN